MVLNDLPQFVIIRLKKYYMALKFTFEAYITLQVTGKINTKEKRQQENRTQKSK